jgi:hypothetical protein
MSMYQLTNDPDVVIQLDTGTFIVRGNWMWDAYEEWLAAGNKPETVPPPTFEEILEAVTPGVQQWMDNTARQKGYDSVVSCATYATSGVPEFAADAAAIIAWRDAVWTAAYAWRDGLNGQLPEVIPTIEEVIAQLPQPEFYGWNSQPYDQMPGDPAPPMA